MGAGLESLGKALENVADTAAGLTAGAIEVTSEVVKDAVSLAKTIIMDTSSIAKTVGQEVSDSAKNAVEGMVNKSETKDIADSIKMDSSSEVIKHENINTNFQDIQMDV